MTFCERHLPFFPAKGAHAQTQLVGRLLKVFRIVQNLLDVAAFKFAHSLFYGAFVEENRGDDFCAG